jgi:hypothetical protein
MYIKKNLFICFAIPLLLILVEGCSKTLEVRQYYNKIRKAEKSIVRGKLKKASTQYSKAFDKSVYPFYRDARNAFVVEVMLDKHDDLIQSYGTILIRYGLDFKTDTNEVLIKYLKTTEKYGQMLRLHDNYSFISYDSSNLNQKFDLIKNLDQDIRKECTKINQGNTYVGFCKDSIIKVDSVNQILLLEVLNQINTHNRKYLNRSSFLTIDLTIAHSMSWNKFPCIEIYYSLVKEGILDARSYAFTFDHKQSEAFDEKDSLLRVSGVYGSHLGFKSGQYFFITRGNTQYELATKNRTKS